MALATFPDLTQTLCAPALVYHTPTNLTNEAGYGTLLGLLDAPARATPNFRTRQTGGEPHGQRPTHEWFMGAWWEFELRIRSWNAAALLLAFPGMTSSTDIRTPGAAAGAGLIPGTNMAVGTTYQKTILCMPIDECAVNPCWLAQAAVCRVAGAVEWGTQGELIVVIRGVCYERAANATNVYRQFFIGNKANATILT